MREQGTTGQIRGRAYEGACSRRVGCHRRSDEHRKEEGEHSEHDELGHVGVVEDSEAPLKGPSDKSQCADKFGRFGAKNVRSQNRPQF